jgi:hypothetical protein
MTMLGLWLTGICLSIFCATWIWVDWRYAKKLANLGVKKWDSDAEEIESAETPYFETHQASTHI